MLSPCSVCRGVIPVLLLACGSEASQSTVDAPSADTAAVDAMPSGPSLWLGINASCSIRPSGKLRCWGNNTSGKLGHHGTGAVGDDETPASVGDVPLAGSVVQVGVGNSHACALDAAGQVRCWGSNMFGQLGTGTAADVPDASVAPIIDVGGVAAEIAVSGQSTCARLITGDVRCWGTNVNGLLGTGVMGAVIGDDEPASAGPLVPLGGPAAEIHSSVFETCARLASGDVRCWGRRYDAMVFGDDEPASAVPVVALGEPAVRLRIGVADACAILATGGFRCWGENSRGRLGYGTVDPVPTPTADVPLGTAVVDVALGRAHTCALLDDGSVRCFGGPAPLNGVPGTTEDIRDAANAVTVDIGGKVAQLASNRFHTCALLESGGVRCWGEGIGGALGYGTAENVGDDETPAMAGDVPVD